MHIAILGATSQIAKDLTLLLSAQGSHELTLFARRPDAVTRWLKNVGLSGRYHVFDVAALGGEKGFNAIINFVGVGNPAQAQAMGASIFDVTLKYDELALRYVLQHPECRYIFLSSGAVYGGSFDVPVDQYSKVILPINDVKPHNWYGVAKVHAEFRHRSMPHLPIIDLRIFNYFSQFSDIEARFLVTDILRAARDGKVFETSNENIVRDYIGPQDFLQLVMKVLAAPPENIAIDCYTQRPVDKFSMLEGMSAAFGLRYSLGEQNTGILATGDKLHYYSKSRKAAHLFGYAPTSASLDLVIEQSKLLLSRV
jgi:nucleoside-diphosphate-sugar epimerase